MREGLHVANLWGHIQLKGMAYYDTGACSKLIKLSKYSNVYHCQKYISVLLPCMACF